MESIRSADGTPIAFERTGEGPPLVLVHGTSADHLRWNPILPALSRHFTVYAVDRRGRGESGDAEPYTIEREFEDIAAVANSIGGSVSLLGHSYGAVCALEAAPRIPKLRRLILYEPMAALIPQALVEQSLVNMRKLLAAGDRDGVVMVLMRDVVEVPPAVITTLRSAPEWPARVAAAHTIPRELAEDLVYTLAPHRFKELHAPTLYLLGSESPPAVAQEAESLRAALPNCRIVLLRGQGHVAITTAPDLFARDVIAFLTESD